MINYPYLNAISRGEQMIDQFYGYDHEDRIPEGAFWDTENLSTWKYPMLSTRKKRGNYRQLLSPNGIYGKAALAWVDGGKLYYDDQDVSSYVGQLTDGEKQIIGMGAYICIWPDKVYFNTQKYTDSGSMENRVQTENAEIHSCLQDGTRIEIARSDTPPENPENGMYWLDTSAKPFSLKMWSAYQNTWSAVVSTYVAIRAGGIGVGFEQWDGVEIAGLADDNNDLNGFNIIQSKTDDMIVVIGMVQGVVTGASVSVSREVPDMEFITESQNRLWGCHYGLNADGTETLNEIYCCKLGDFKNWRCYEGISTDSYAASCGTDGEWTGACTHMGYPLFFKENHLHKVYISTSGAHQIVDTECRGVQKGCHKSLAIVDNVLYYKSRDGICAYDGSMPQPAGSLLGNGLYYDAVGGAIGNRYYVSMADADGNWSLFALDVKNRLWMREDITHAIAMARCRDDLFILTEDGRILAEDGTEGEPEEDLRWFAETGVIGYDQSGHKYVSRFNIRMKLPRGSVLKVMIQYESDGIWTDAGTIYGNGLNSFVLPVRPRRCDHFRIRMEGRGSVDMYSFSKTYEGGSDGH